MSEENLKALSRLAALISEGYPFAALQSKVKNFRVDIVAPQGAHAPLLEVINQFRADAKQTQVQLVVVATGREAEDVAAALRSLSPDAEILEFPSWETLPHERLSPSPETVGKRLQVLHRLNELSDVAKNKKLDHSVFVLASVRAVLQPVVAHCSRASKWPPKAGARLGPKKADACTASWANTGLPRTPNRLRAVFLRLWSPRAQGLP